MDAAKFETSNEWHKNVTKETTTNGQNRKMVSDSLYCLHSIDNWERAEITRHGFWCASSRYYGKNTNLYISQVVQNACTALAIIKSGRRLGEHFQHWRRYGSVGKPSSLFTMGCSYWDPQTLGELLTSSPQLREIHNSLSPPSAISLE